MNEHADKVRHERLRRDWSVRQAASAGGISNTYWGNFEDYKQPLTPAIAGAVARAFKWSTSWADELETSGYEPIRSLGGESLTDLVADGFNQTTDALADLRRYLMANHTRMEQIADHLGLPSVPVPGLDE